MHASLSQVLQAAKIVGGAETRKCDELNEHSGIEPSARRPADKFLYVCLPDALQMMVERLPSFG
jgi:hypothetical protein